MTHLALATHFGRGGTGRPCPDGLRPLSPIAALLLAAPGCDENPARSTPAAATSAPAIPSVTIDAAPPPQASASREIDAGSDAGLARYDPKHKCPTGLTHFY